MCFPFPFIFMLIWLSVFMMSNIRCQTLNTPRFYNKCCCSPIYVVFFVRLRIYLSTVLSPFLCNISKIYQSLWRSLCQPLRRLSKFFSMFRKLAEIFLRHCSPNLPNLYKRYPQSSITNALVTDKRRDDQPNFWYHWRLFFAYSTSWTPTLHVAPTHCKLYPA